MLMNHDSLKSQKTFKIVAVCIATIILGINMSYAQDGHRFLYLKIFDKLQFGVTYNF